MFLWFVHVMYLVVRFSEKCCYRQVRWYSKPTTYSRDEEINGLQLEHAKVPSMKHELRLQGSRPHGQTMVRRCREPNRWSSNERFMWPATRAGQSTIQECSTAYSGRISTNETACSHTCFAAQRLGPASRALLRGSLCRMLL